jgi:16S rRNA (guanine966-N2)-methyltransferase
MRLTGGQFRGRILQVPKGDAVRPATDKVRQAVFNSLLGRMDLDGAHVMDGFCGSGSYGLEALSRGAQSCFFIDKDRTSLSFCKKNIEQLGVQDKCQVMQKDVLSAPPRSEDQPLIDLLFLDPPYHKGLLLPAFEHVCKAGWLSPDAVCVLECETDLDVPFGDQKTYGAIKIIYTAPL